ncbi:hypothetical protein [Limnohabitans sp.]|uniref:hypothetical protein n=1 Tax=Limnohabitans sp. TaxID=1907725 RepID=UPI0039BD4855|nr:hypothetical protein [Comamonadaceae bacterium]
MNTRLWLQAPWASWLAGGSDWDIRFQAHWRWWTRRWGFAVMACLLAWGLGVWLHASTRQAHAQLKSDVQILHAKLVALPTPRPKASGPLMSDDVNRLPSLDQQEQVWAYLRKTLAQHQVKLMLMQPASEVGHAPLPSQAMLLNLQARYENWADAWASLVHMGPVWSMDRLRVVTSADKQSVDIEVVWRAWFSPGRAGSLPHNAVFAGGLPALPQAPLAKHMASVFDMPFSMTAPLERETRTVVMQPKGVALGVLPDSAGLVDAPPKEPLFLSEPERWPMLPLRLIGTWRQGDQAEAVLANAAHWFRTQEGRQISLEGHKVWRIGRDVIHVRDTAGRLQTIQMEARGP